MSDLGKVLVAAGSLLVVAGLLLWILGRTGFRGLPGDIRYETDNVRIYFPVVSMLLLSLILSAIVWLIQWLGGR